MEFDAWISPQLTPLLRFATVLSGSPDLAQDLVQDVVLKCQLRWASLQRLDHRDAYVRRMLVNEHLSFRRRFTRVVLHDVVDRPETDDRPTFDQSYADRQALLADLDRLPRRQRAVLVLRYYEDLGDAEIADLLGCRPSTVRAYAARALATLRLDHTAPAAAEDSRAH